MKRDSRLRGLSSDHHHALVLARDVGAKAGAFGPVDGAALGARIDAELEPHFRVEDEVLLPALQRAGASELVARVADDHAFLRANGAAARLGDGAAARAFAERLVEHVRFEERELFPACEAMLPGDVLERVARRRPGPLT
jgi:hypothetical protein